ncbi:hypothetical protein GALMADRAFT_57643 [Galerina marginata CBS 339.88]|uniref:Uncharacterized protein n=1 Tax=Galerina marginata (strain CBS 339.88) TaxID=685588 RepID=A0A067TKW9_GALM3|nr:hypothetical protein GALMADRAFT_57643 [Galerina marginata CBS 339.88]
MNESYVPAESLAFRAKLAQLVSPLRRIRTRTPFFRLAAHRIPTLWSLYRGLLRNSPTEHVKFRVRLLFRENRHLTGVAKTRERLNLAYKYLDFFRKATDGDKHCQDVMLRYSRLIEMKRDKARMTRLMCEELNWLEQRRNQPIMTGSFIRPSLFNVPLPRLKPQPQATSMIFSKRIKARQWRHDRKKELEEQLADLAIERQFEEGLRRLVGFSFPTCYSGPAAAEWTQPILDAIEGIKDSQRREQVRAATPYPPELIKSVFEARRERIRNKTREKERERRGEVLKSTLKRQRRGPPAHVLAKWSPERRAMDRVARSLSEVGYVALVKRRLGFKLKDPEAGLELGEPENRPILDQVVKFIRTENKKRAIEEELTTHNSRQGSGSGMGQHVEDSVDH